MTARMGYSVLVGQRYLSDIVVEIVLKCYFPPSLLFFKIQMIKWLGKINFQFKRVGTGIEYELRAVAILRS